MRFPKRRHPATPDGEAHLATLPLGEILARVQALVDQGQPDDAVDLLAAVARTRREPEILIELRDLRELAARTLPAPPGRETWPPVYADPFPGLTGQIPEVRPDELTTDLLGGAVAHHGALCVRGLLDAAAVGAVVEATKQAQQRQIDPDAEPDQWFSPFDTARKIEVGLRDMVKGQGGTWLADSPAATAVVLDQLESVGVIRLVQEHFQERPCFSLQKSTLRCVQPAPRITAWHQDGSFLDPDVRTMNVWVALSPCGGDHPASGLELFPARVEEILPTDPEWTRATVPFALVEELAVETPTVRPRFEPGDALLFDEHLLHRTALDPGLTEVRYALECWLFAPSHTTSSYTAFLV